MEALMLILTLLVLFDLVVMRWGVDSRGSFSPTGPSRR
jgi:hypothetical protein